VPARGVAAFRRGVTAEEAAMRHITPDGLDRLEDLLTALRALAGLREKKRGVFYRGSRAFLHFHEHGAELFADVRLSEDFERMPVTTAAQRRVLLSEVRRVC
jgi:hypothetical protein